MKKLLSLLFFLFATVGVWADHWTPSSAYTQGDAVIYAEVVSNSYTGASEVAAFIDGVCVASAKTEHLYGGREGIRAIYGYVLRARGNNNLVGKEITFKAYNDTTHLEYKLTPSEKITFQLTGTYGYPSNPIKLMMKAPDSYAIKPIEVGVGEKVDLNDFVTLTPADSEMPDGLWWSIDNTDYAEIIDGHYLKGKALGSGTIMLWVPSWGGRPTLVDGNYTVVNHVTAINIVTDEVTFELGERTISLFMQNRLGGQQAYSLTPPDATNEVSWELKDDGIIVLENGSYRSVKTGTTQIRPYVVKSDGTRLYPPNNKWITVHIVVSVTSIAFDTSIIYANVGDDIYQRLANHVIVSPSNATNPSFTFYTGSTDLLDIKGSSAVVKAAGSGTITVTSSSTWKTGDTSIGVCMHSIDFIFYDPLKEVSFRENPLYVDKNSETVSSVQGRIANNIVISDKSRVQEGMIDLAGVLTGSGSLSSSGVSVTLTSKQLEKGVATVTVTLGWKDYSTNDAGKLVWGSPQSFTVNIGSDLTTIDILVRPDVDNPTSGVIQFVPRPDDIDFNWDELSFDISNNNLSWNTFSINKIANGTYNYSCDVPGTYMIDLKSPIEGHAEVQVPFKAILENGWQWKSNPYGVLDGNYDTFFGTDFAEARTWSNLLINDPSWGYYGTMLGIVLQQNEMYKVKMNAANTSYLYNGNIDGAAVSVSIQPGWNWVGSPFIYNRLLANSIKKDSGLVKGIVIMSKDDGSAEYDGSKWVGDLKAIKRGQGYIIFNPGSKELVITFNGEKSMSAGNEDGSPQGSPARMWDYDHTRFASNMTVVAVLENLVDAERYTIGAFVGDECRGEGHFIDGLAFITVHSDGGEEVSFRLYDTLTGSYSDIDQTMISQIRLGSLDSPIKLTCQSELTGISTINDNNQSGNETFDANGRRLNGLKHGLNIVRKTDGTVRKVFVK